MSDPDLTEADLQQAERALLGIGGDGLKRHIFLCASDGIAQHQAAYAVLRPADELKIGPAPALAVDQGQLEETFKIVALNRELPGHIPLAQCHLWVEQHRFGQLARIECHPNLGVLSVTIYRLMPVRPCDCQMPLLEKACKRLLQ